VKPRSSPFSWVGAWVAVSAVIGLLVGLRAVVAFEPPHVVPLLHVPPIPREGLGIAWSARAAWPVDIQSAALGRLVRLLVAIVSATVGIATLNVLVLLAEGAVSRRRALAVRVALGASPMGFARALIREMWTLGVAGVSMGLVLGLAGGGAARASWPGVVLGPHITSGLGDASLALLPIAALIVWGHAGTAWRSLRGSRLQDALRAGGRVTADPGAVFVRRALPVLQMAVAGSVSIAALTLSGGIRIGGRADSADRGAVVVGAAAPAPGSWRTLLTELAAVPGLEAESLSTPGALVGLGIRDYVTTQCGACVRGGLPVPLWGAVADNHAVTPGFFALSGTELIDGRAFTWRDGLASERVALVSRAFARSSFEDGRPIGKRIQLGTSLDAWYTVIGVVADSRSSVLGTDDRPREAVYLSALQQPPRSGYLLLLGSDDAVAESVAMMRREGFIPSEPVPLRDFRRARVAPLRWMQGVGFWLALMTLALTAHGVHATALQVARHRRREMAIRRALGTRTSSLILLTLGEHARVGLWGVAGMTFFGTMLVAFLREVAGVTPAGPALYLAVATGLVLLSVAASLRATTEALSVEPGAVIE
jgi:putative ABC transport system permease protein